MACRIVFVCVGNRARSVFGEFFFPIMLRKEDPHLEKQVTVLSAGFVPQSLKDQLREANVDLPDPFFNRSMGSLARKALVERGIPVPEQWVSKALTPEMVRGSDLIVAALDDIRDELKERFPEVSDRIFTIKELAKWEGYLILEDADRPPLDHTYWHFVDEDPVYAAKIIDSMEECLVRAYPNILKQMGLDGE